MSCLPRDIYSIRVFMQQTQIRQAYPGKPTASSPCLSYGFLEHVGAIWNLILHIQLPELLHSYSRLPGCQLASLRYMGSLQGHQRTEQDSPCRPCSKNGLKLFQLSQSHPFLEAVKTTWLPWSLPRAVLSGSLMPEAERGHLDSREETTHCEAEV
jgi:hypothetical protein